MIVRFNEEIENEGNRKRINKQFTAIFFAGAKLNLTALEDGECTAELRGN